MLRSSLFTACAMALVAGASAQKSPPQAPPQTPLALKAQKVRGAVKHAGIYHVATGTWTRGTGASANFGPDTIYSNTAASGYFSSAGGNGGFAPRSENFDEGNVPSSTNTNNPGDRDEYLVNCIEIGYCDFKVGGASRWELNFYTHYTPCTLDTLPDATVNSGPLPTGGCWMVALDLTGGDEICLRADGGDGFDDDDDLDSFGWSYRYINTGTAEAGFLLTGDPQSTDPNWVTGGSPVDGTNTYFGPASLCSATEATGLKTGDFWFIEDPVDPATNSGCYFFGGYNNINSCGGPARAYASWHIELQADTGACESCLFSCPNGCLSNPNSTGVNSTMIATGSTSVAANDVTLTATIPVNSFGFFITSQTAGFVPMPGGSAGNICLGANIGRFQTLAANSGAAGMVSISTSSGQWSLTSIPQATGPYAAVPGGTAHFQCWHRDSSTFGPTMNFTDGIVVTWTL